MSAAVDRWERAVRDRMRGMPWQFFGVCACCGRPGQWVAGRRRSRCLCAECWSEKGV